MTVCRHFSTLLLQSRTVNSEQHQTMYRLLFWTHNINKNPIIQTLIFRFHLELLQPSQIHFPRYSAFTRNNLEEKGVPRFINQPTHLCFLQTHACKQTHIYTRMQTHTDTHAWPQHRWWGGEADMGKLSECQITGLDKLHFNCDRESCLDGWLVFSPP